jgi:hypothetical protein
MGPRSTSWARHPALPVIVALLMCATGLWLRAKVAGYELGLPLIDENEVVEQAVAFMGGDLRYHFLKYGPFTMYVLAGIYHVVAALRGMSALEYASQVFFEGGEHYFIARLYVGFTITVLALLAFFHFRRHYGAAAALFACALLAFPLVDTLTKGVRIDMAQAAFQGMALLALGEAVTRPLHRYWIAAGVFAGLAIATKPLPGLLILPAFVPASWLAARHGPEGEVRRWTARLGKTVASPGPWLAALACVSAAVIANPAMLDFGTFVESQRAAIELHSDSSAGSHQEITKSARLLGVPLLVGIGLSAALALLRREPKALVVAFFLATYVGAFSTKPSRHYFLVGAAVAACLLVGHGFALAVDWASKARPRPWLGWTWLPLAAILLLSPVQGMLARVTEPSMQSLARDWIYENIPSGTRLFHAGWRPSGPQLVATSKKLQASWGTHFGYGRENYEFLKQAFDLGYADYVKSGQPRYAITVHNAIPLPRSTKRTPRSVTDSLLKNARAKKQRYIILAGYREKDVRELGYKWFDSAILEGQFGKVAIFRVPEAVEAAGAAAAPPSSP